MEHTQKQNQNISTDMAVFLKQKRTNVCKHMIMPSICPLLIEKDARVRQNISIKFPSFCLPVLQWSLQFLVRVFTFLFNQIQFCQYKMRRLSFVTDTATPTNWKCLLWTSRSLRWSGKFPSSRLITLGQEVKMTVKCMKWHLFLTCSVSFCG